MTSNYSRPTWQPCLFSIIFIERNSTFGVWKFQAQRRYSGASRGRSLTWSVGPVRERESVFFFLSVVERSYANNCSPWEAWHNDVRLLCKLISLFNEFRNGCRTSKVTKRVKLNFMYPSFKNCRSIQCTLPPISYALFTLYGH